MSICSNVKTIRLKAYSIGKKIWFNYYIKNKIECRRNKELLKKARNNFKIKSAHKPSLISVLIPTYNRANTLMQRAIPSVLRQTYQNFEIIVVGDHCTDSTEDLLKDFNDERIKFYNLPKRGKYPKNFYDRWCVAGTVPWNKAIDLSSGDWIAPLDDDDEFSENHLKVLLNCALKYDYEMVYGKVRWERKPNKWIDVGSYPLKYGRISHLSVLYSSNLKFIKYDVNAWKYGEPADWNMWRRMKEAGVRVGFIDKVVGNHYLEGTQRGA